MSESDKSKSKPKSKSPEPTGRKYVYRNVDTRSFISKPMAQRNLPSKTLESAYIAHPASTRKVVMPIVDCRKESSVKKMKYSVYNSTSTYNPGRSAPYSGYANNVDHESLLFNRFAPLQKGGKHDYVPGTNSGLYREQNYSTNEVVPFKQLNKREVFNPFNPNKCNLATNLFANHTRQQTKDL